MGVVEVDIPAQNAPNLRQNLLVVDQVEEQIVVRDKVGIEEGFGRVMPSGHLLLIDAVAGSCKRGNLFGGEGVFYYKEALLIKLQTFFIRQDVREAGSFHLGLQLCHAVTSAQLRRLSR